MDISILGSGGCMVIPKPLCTCRVCVEARTKGIPYSRTGPSVFIHDENILVDTPAEIALQLNRFPIKAVDYLLFSHLDPDHVEGFRVVEQIANDFRSWRAYPEKRIRLVLPEQLSTALINIHTVYGPQVEYYMARGYVECLPFREKITIGGIEVVALPVDRGDQTAFIYVFNKKGRKVVYAPCDIKPFPEAREAVRRADLLIIQPGIIEGGLKHQFIYDKDHISRKTLYTMAETIALSRRIEARKVVFVHLEEYWNRSHDDYVALQDEYRDIYFAYDGMRLNI